MANKMEHAELQLNDLIAKLLEEGVTVREVNAVLLSVATTRWADEVGDVRLRNTLVCVINEIDDGAFRPDYVPPEARDDNETIYPSEKRLTVIDGGAGGGQKA